jgi:hypothetical protein
MLKVKLFESQIFFKSYESKRTKGPKQNRQNQLRVENQRA